MQIQNLTIMVDMDVILEKLNEVTGLLHDRKSTNSNIMVTCPFHKNGKESKPSCGVNVNTGEVHCFTCGYKTRELEEFVSNIFGKLDGGLFGYKWLAKNFASMEIEDRRVVVDFGKDANKEEIDYIKEDVLASYRYTHSYMYERNLTDKLINYFDIGFDKETNSITFPLNDINGKCLLVQKRSVTSKFFSNPEDSFKSKTLFGIDKLFKIKNKVKKLYVTESILDSLIVWKYKKYAVPLLGTSISPEQIKLIEQLGIRHLVLAFDNDKWGRVGIKKVAKQLDGFIVTQLKYPKNFKDGGDINDLKEEQFITCTETFV